MVQPKLVISHGQNRACRSLELAVSYHSSETSIFGEDQSKADCRVGRIAALVESRWSPVRDAARASARFGHRRW